MTDQMEYYSNFGLKRAAKGKLAYQSGIAIGTYFLQIAILFGIVMISVLAMAGTMWQPIFSLLYSMDPMGSDIMEVQQKMQDMMLTPRYLIGRELFFALIGALSVTLTTGYSNVCLKISRSEKAKVMDLFFVYRNNPDRVILLYLLVFVIQSLISLPSNVVSFYADTQSQNAALTMLSTALFLVSLAFSYVFSLMVSQVYFLYLDDIEKPVLAVFKESVELMRGHKLRLFSLQFSFIGWTLLSFLTLGVLQIWLGPYMGLTFTEFYRNLKKEPLWVATQGYQEQV